MRVGSPGVFAFGNRASAQAPFAKFHAAIAATKAGQSNTIVNDYGDSTTQGAGAGGPNGSTVNARVSAYPAILASLLNSYVAASSAVSVNGTNALTASNYALYNPSLSYATPGDWANNGGNFGGNMFQTAVNNSRIIWTCPRNVDTFELTVANVSNGGVAAVYFDGSPTPTDTFSTLKANPSTITKRTYTVPLGTHSIEIAKTSGAFLYVAQIVAYNSAQKEIMLFNGGAGGFTAAQIAASGAAFDSVNMGASLNPALSIVNVGLNDFPANTPQASFEASLTTLVNAGRLTGDVLLVFPNSRNLIAQEAAFFGYYQNVAAALNVPLIDLRTVLGTISEANAAGYMSGDNVHPSALGYQVIAQYIYDTITAGLVV